MEVALVQVLGQGFETPRVPPGGDAARHRVQGVVVQRVPLSGEDVARQRELLAGRTPYSRPGNPDATPAERDLTRRRPGAARAPVRIAPRARAAQGLAVLLHHGVEHLTTGRDTQIEERMLNGGQDVQERNGNPDGRRLSSVNELEGLCFLGMLRHSGGSFVVW